MTEQEKKHLTEEEVIETINKEKRALHSKTAFLRRKSATAKGILKEELEKRILELERITVQRTIFLMELDFEREFEKNKKETTR